MKKSFDTEKSLNLIVILGPTASGKTAFAAHLALALDGEVISADSRQVYRGMDLGTGKDIEDYQIGDQIIPCHLIDIVNPDHAYNVYEFQRDFLEAYGSIRQEKKLPILCGGSGLYLEAVLKGYKLIEVPPDQNYRAALAEKSDEELTQLLDGMSKLHNTSDISSRKRLIRAIEIARHYQHNPREDKTYPSLNHKIIGIRFDRESERKRITARLHQRLEGGMIEEVKTLIDLYGSETIEYFGLEYKFLSWHLSGQITYDEMYTKLNTAIHQFAKRQMTWFRRMQRNGFAIHWIDGYTPMEEKIRQAIEFLNGEN
ncbi:MAG: tRNA (adenosine(37)-N6)-dimethylallyltransferase MiaA [Bacteroidetes bacterium]|jgi:tRNA dimethylallyltransferase|nr:tRNA (adenosine(37)-N6)-dimethylallyltransferase MiaA [Bacteroidota bacterium]MBT7941509.1 tRNA (adenosine(37)-N6)-dimethylallyltransferase MiaA [Candidatus Neomarinimicrobiota bacterium]MBT3748313.1 tRNA (adenosine(37)-N6)-dimethylallyltransferase MiaA [Bacteroidota bacterium]MBT4411590.1 tRNA (adenosine(37)-N6)-dimethylallyltransferase MiaA [Bacteroidota bacterium]MBT5425927.1 tRNA (adenosine(37)-N6)-dimethylallyltransferase MiaA [Bacteroidota bacterium]